MTEPFFKSYLLGRNFVLDEIKDLNDSDLNTLNIETMAALEDARYQYSKIEDKNAVEAGPVYARMKVAGYFQAAIKLELSTDV
jgi:hypothetical protein